MHKGLFVQWAIHIQFCHILGKCVAIRHIETRFHLLVVMVVLLKKKRIERKKLTNRVNFICLRGSNLQEHRNNFTIIPCVIHLQSNIFSVFLICLLVPVK